MTGKPSYVHKIWILIICRATAPFRIVVVFICVILKLVSAPMLLDGIGWIHPGPQCLPFPEIVLRALLRGYPANKTGRGEVQGTAPMPLDGIGWIHPVESTAPRL